MKQQKISALLTVIGFFVAAVTSNAAPKTEVSANLLSTIQRQADGNAADTFSISFGALNGGLFALTTKDSSADSAAGFALWYGNNSRTLLSWGSPVQGSLITDSDDFYQYWGSDGSVGTRKGDALTSIFDSAKDNRALAFVTYSSGGAVQEVGLYDLGFVFADPAAAALGTFDFLTLSSDVTAIYGATSPSTGTYGSISTSNVPEPSSSLLLLVGGLALAGVRQFRKKIKQETTKTKEINKMKKNLFLILVAAFAVGSIQSANAAKFVELANLGTGLVDTLSTGTVGGVNATIITKDLRLTRDKTYILGRNTIIKAGVTVTVDAGTLMRCEFPTVDSTSGILPSDPGAWVAHRGGRLVMNGTAEAPIILTTMDDPNVPGGNNTIPAVENLGVTAASKTEGNQKVYKAYTTAGNVTSGSVGSGEYTLLDGLAVSNARSYSKDPSVAGNIFSLDGKYGGFVFAGRANLGARMSSTSAVNNARTIKQADGSGGGAQTAGYTGASGVEQIEGMAGFTGYTWYGGDDDLDNSGKARFTQTRYGGYVIITGKELNGFTWCAAGMRTVGDFHESFGNADDDNEFFGGCVGTKYAVDAYSGDDGHDIDQGYCGVNQFGLHLQNSCDVAGNSSYVNPASSGLGASGKKVENAGDQVNEIDGPENVDSTAGPGGPLSVFTLANFTGIGRGYGPSGWVKALGGTAGIPLDGPNFRDNSSGKIWNAMYMDIPQAGPVFASQSATSDVASNQTDTVWHLQNSRTSGGYDNTGRDSDLVTSMSTGPGEPDLLIRNCAWFRSGLAQTLTTLGANDSTGFTGGKYSTKTAFDNARTVGNANYDANWWIASRLNLCPVFTSTSSERQQKSGVVINMNPNSASGSIVSTSTAMSTTGATTDTTTGNSFNLDPGYTVPIDNRTSQGSLDLRLGATSSARTTTVALPTRGNLNPDANFIGAFKDSNWARAWTMLERAGVFSGTVGSTQIAPVVTVSVNSSGQPVLSFATENNVKYSVEASVDDNHYRPLATVTGDGTVKSYPVTTGLTASATQAAPYTSADIVTAYDTAKRTTSVSTFAAIPATVSSQPLLFRVIAF